MALQNGLAQSKSSAKQLSSVTRTFGILEQLARHKQINLERLAVETELPKPTLHRFLSTLVELGYVYKDLNDQYSLTLKMFSVGSRGLAHMELSKIAEPVAEQLRDTLGETVHMGILDEQYAMYIIKIESLYTIRMYSRVGKRIPLYCTSIGKVILAGLPQTRRKAMLDCMQLVRFTSSTISERVSLETELDAIIESGFAEDREEHEKGIRCIAVPVKDHEGNTVAGLSVSWPVFRFDEKEKEHYLIHLKQAGDGISARLVHLH